MKYLISLILIFFYALGNNVFAEAENTCRGKFPEYTDICWECIFPLTIGKNRIYSKLTAYDYSENPEELKCQCGGKEGYTLGFWEPIAMVDVTRTPFCLVNMGGIQLENTSQYGIGTVSRNDAFYYVHWYKVPFIRIFSKINLDNQCIDSTLKIKLEKMTELDPAWRDDALSFITYPEAILFGTTAAQMACGWDTLATTQNIKPNDAFSTDTLFWCAGGQGSMYPLMGHVQDYSSGVQASLLLSERMTYKLHRDKTLLDSVPIVKDEKICKPVQLDLIPKSRYRYQMLYPIPTTNNNKIAADDPSNTDVTKNKYPFGGFPLGYSTTEWESSHQFPMNGEDFGYLIWRKRNCCAGLEMPPYE